MTTTTQIALPPTQASRARWPRVLKRAVKRVVPAAAALYFVPLAFVGYVALGLLDFTRNRQRTLVSLDRYFAGNGFFTWVLSPFNLLLDLFSLPYRNRGIYRLEDLPEPYRDEIAGLMRAAQESNVVGQLREKLGDKKRGMIFFKWYGKNVQSSVDVPEFHRAYKYVRTIGVSVFNTKQSTTKHFGPLRVTLRVLYNINDMTSDQAYIKVGSVSHRWREEKLFIFDDTLQHQSFNETDEPRYCLFVDILRPSRLPRLMDAVLSCVRVAVSRFNFAFYKHWVFIK